MGLYANPLFQSKLWLTQYCNWLYTCCHVWKSIIYIVYTVNTNIFGFHPQHRVLKSFEVFFFCCIWISKVFLFYFWKSIKIWMRSFVDECHLIVLCYIYCISCCFFCCSFCFWLLLVLWDFYVVVLAFSHFIIQLLKDIEQSGHSVSMFCQWK